jgi:hypothetical protein
MFRSVFATNRREQKKAMRSRAFLNGVEVTRRCQIADSTVGRVLLFDLDENGRPFLDPVTREVARRWHHGRVEIKRITA